MRVITQTAARTEVSKVCFGAETLMDSLHLLWKCKSQFRTCEFGLVKISCSFQAPTDLFEIKPSLFIPVWIFQYHTPPFLFAEDRLIFMERNLKRS